MRKLLVVSVIAMCSACAEEPPDKDGWDLLGDSDDDTAVQPANDGATSTSSASTQPHADTADGDEQQSAATQPAAPDVECIDGASGFGTSDGDWTCDSAVTCDGVEYKMDCVNDDCSCFVDGELVAEISTQETCLYKGMRECGAPIPPVNPHCYDDQIWSGGGVGDNGGFCETGTICNDVSYRVECFDDTGECICFVDDEPGPVISATTEDCFDGKDRALRECGALLQPSP